MIVNVTMLLNIKRIRVRLILSHIKEVLLKFFHVLRCGGAAQTVYLCILMAVNPVIYVALETLSATKRETIYVL